MWINYDALIAGSTQNFILGLVGIGFQMSASIDAAHELLHRPEIGCRLAAYLTLIAYQFTVYPVEHLYLHHKKVGTSEDPITSPKNQSFYSYYVKAIYSAYKFNYNYNKKIFLGCVAATLGYHVFLASAAYLEGSGFGKYLFFALLSYFALIVMEGVEYIEHYGLVYRKGEHDEKVTEICSWNTSTNALGNWLIFRFQRHSDHHMNAYKIYSTLDLTDKMPQLPICFVEAVFLCLVPPLWKSLFNPLVDEVLEGKTLPKYAQFKIRVAASVIRGLLILNPLIALIKYL